MINKIATLLGRNFVYIVYRCRKSKYNQSIKRYGEIY